MVSHDPAKFGGHRYRGSGDLMLSEVEGQDSILLQFVITIYL